MSWFQSEIKNRNFKRYSIQSQSLAQNPPPEPPLPVPSNAETSPAMLFIIVILAVIFFISGLLHLLARFIMRHRPSSSNQNLDISDSRNFQRQLHQLFNIHDSGLDQEIIDALPLFQYKDISGLKEPFDCAVCLCEFSEHDNLRLLPICSHAFHVDCIDTWLLSNSTCPLCRGALYTPALNTTTNLVKDWREEDGVLGLSLGGCDSPNEVETVVEKRRVFPVILGKFTSSVNEEQGENISEFSSCNLDVRRCFSMGSCQYVVADSELQVALSSNRAEEDGDLRIFRVRAGNNDKASVDGDVKGKKISAVSKHESFSVSKIWLWSNKDRICGSPSSHTEEPTSVNMTLP